MMIREIFPLLACLTLTPRAWARPLPSSDKIIFHIRETFAIPANIPITLSAIEPSPLPGLERATMTIGQEPQVQRNTVYFSKDGEHYFIAELEDLSIDPDSSRRSKISLEGFPSQGPQDAAVAMVEYSDFECPHCMKAATTLKEELPKLGGKVRLVFKYFPLTNIHPWSEAAAVAAACAYKQKPDAFWTFYDGYFSDQPNITKENVRPKSLAFAEKAGLDAAKFSACFDNKETLPDIKRSMEEGESVGVNSTPTFYLNGHILRGFSDFEPVRRLIEEIAAGKHRA